MTQLEKLKLRLGEDAKTVTENDLSDALDSAKSVILSRRFPLCDWPVDTEGEIVLEARYLDLQVRIAIELISKRGAEGQTTHNEGTVQRTYETGSVSKSLLAEITPMAVIV